MKMLKRKREVFASCPRNGATGEFLMGTRYTEHKSNRQLPLAVVGCMYCGER